MANSEHLEILSQGKSAWRAWRKAARQTPDLSEATLEGRDLSHLDFSETDLRGTSFLGSTLRGSRFGNSDLTGCNARSVTMSGAKFTNATLKEADLRASSLRRADLTNADLSSAILRFTSLVGANIEGAILTGAEIYGTSAWNLKGEPKDQSGLIIREDNDPGTITTTIDDLDTAQYLFLLRENAKIADIINTASQRTVLLLGRFAPSYKKILDGLKKHLLDRNFVPVLFDFNKPDGRNLTETVASLANMACFVIPDLSGAKSVPQELSFIVPFLPSVPVLPIFRDEKDQYIYSMFEHFLRYPWVHKPVRYTDLEHLLKIVDKEIINVGYREAMRARGVKTPKLPPRPKAPKSKTSKKKTSRKRKRPVS